jgi:DNA-binding MarR family transcriptional regulator
MMSSTASSSTPGEPAVPAVPARPNAPFGDPRIDPLRGSLSHLLGAERRLRGRDHSRPDELTYGQMRCIGALGRERELTAGQLARSADLTPATVTAILDQLEAAEIVQRHRSTTDRRVCNVALTERGWTLLDRTLSKVHELWAQRLAEFSDEELETAGRVIERIGEILDTISTGLERSPDDASLTG